MSIEKVLVDDFEFLVNKGEIAIAVDIDEGPVTSADLSYDGRDCLVLIRNNKKAYLLTNILTPIRERLKKLDSILILERRGEKHEIMNAYMADIRHVDEVPYPDNFAAQAQEYVDKLRAELGDAEFAELMKSLNKEYMSIARECAVVQ